MYKSLMHINFQVTLKHGSILRNLPGIVLALTVC